MPDSKITALTALTAADPANDMFPVVDVSDTTMAASGTTKRISINNILACSPSATLASATITGDLTVDTSTLYVSSSTDKVGIGTTSLSGEKLTVAGNVSANAWVGRGNITVPSGDCSIFRSADNTLSFGIASTTAMTLNSTGLGVGGSPTTKLGIFAGADGDVALFRGGSTRQVQIGTSATAGYLNTDNGSAGLEIRTQGVARAYFDNSGNVGIGVTPSAAWNAGGNIQVGNLGALYTNNTLGATDLAYNSIRTGADTYQYLFGSSVAASRFQQRDGSFRFFTAPAGTSPNAITFTQAMTLDASGNLLVGTTSAAGVRLDVQTATGNCIGRVKSNAAASTASFIIDYVETLGCTYIKKAASDVWIYGVQNDTSATPAFKINTASNVGVQLVSGATAWTTLSDETVKDIIEPISNAVAKVGSLRSVIGKFKTDDASKRRSFLIAQDVQSVLPEAVDVIGENNELGLRYTEVIPLLVAAIKELTAEVNALKKA